LRIRFSAFYLHQEEINYFPRKKTHRERGGKTSLPGICGNHNKKAASLLEEEFQTKLGEKEGKSRLSSFSSTFTIFCEGIGT
jgi:hypothetical protein